MQEIYLLFITEELKSQFTVNMGSAMEQFFDHLKDDKRATIDLSVMRCQPSSKEQCLQMTNDLYRVFSQVFFPQHKYGNLSLFVCEFIEAKNGMIYFNQIKAFECDYKDVIPV